MAQSGYCRLIKKRDDDSYVKQNDEQAQRRPSSLATPSRVDGARRDGDSPRRRAAP
jgi:hypothetical protein